MGILDDLIYSAKSDLNSGVREKATSGIRKGMSKIFGGGSTSSAIKCPKCSKSINDSSLKFCPECGQKLFAACAKCNTEYPVGTKFCTKDGEALS